MVHLYDNNLKFLVSLNYEYEDFIKEPSKYYLDWEISFYATQDKYNSPILSDGALREKTREELILIDNKLELLQDGEYIKQGKIIVVPCPEGLLKKKWDKIAHVWGEGATIEELKEYYFNKINTYKAEILEVGFDFNGHQQKCREKDLALLGNAVSALDDMQTFKVIVEEHQINWAFNDNDIVSMTETDLRELRMSGAIFINTVYGVEAQLKASEANILLEKQDFIKKVDELSTVKCFKSSI
ncbi:hypothetical protein [uncultured Fusobacterium sp.]|uniref:hypothetical protein n=1 Tax=uncultured Fusobacterium sp. TaxID=159267 RepID=UPI0025EB6B5A|nr:hypothetical protein [uncultured Fusobacterium sp.]